jgi:hypothetical protein
LGFPTEPLQLPVYLSQSGNRKISELTLLMTEQPNFQRQTFIGTGANFSMQEITRLQRNRPLKLFP